MTNLGHLNYFLGMEIDQDVATGKVLMRQTKFAKDVLEKFGMEYSNPVKTARSRTQVDQSDVRRRLQARRNHGQGAVP
ncbi:hypothetical protein PI125_g25256 [Phytophthora idaei]|nr:hypothetical protein PI125_g25256 [Phytophthora idaei]